MKSLKEEVESFKYFDRDLNQLVDDPMVPGAGLCKNMDASVAFAREKQIVERLLGIESYLNIKSEFYKKQFKKMNVLDFSNMLNKETPIFLTESEFDLYLKTYNELFELR